MPLTRKQKEQILEDLKEKMNRQKTMIFVDFAGLKTKDLQDLRKKLKENNSLFKVSKKTLFKKALESYQKSWVEFVDDLKGELGVVFGFGDELSPVKIVYQFSEQNENLKILGGVFENAFIGKKQISELAKIPGRQELLSRLVGSIKAPLSNFVGVLENNIKGLLYILSAINK
ncbi:50S ribosomal protein L10 [bacterium]|nr:50S ribosomal protein L10 [bacterium]